MDDKIVLDKKSFEALAVDTRVNILKSLKERRKTLTELSQEQKMSVSGIKEHLEILEKTGLIEKIDDGHKWKYYELTKKGKEIVGPKEVKVMILLSISIVSFIASMFVLMTPTYLGFTSVTQDELAPIKDQILEDKMMVTADRSPEAAEAPMAEEDEIVNALPRQPLGQQMEALNSPTIPGAVAMISLITILACVGILIKNRMTTFP